MRVPEPALLVIPRVLIVQEFPADVVTALKPIGLEMVRV
jgi:hypothetical protein